MAARTWAKVSGDMVAWVNATVDLIVDGGDKPPSRQTLYRDVPRRSHGAGIEADGGPSGRGDGRSTAALNGLSDKDFAAGQRIWIDEAVDELVDQGAVTEDDDGSLRWATSLKPGGKVRFHDREVRVHTPEERRWTDEIGGFAHAIRGHGHLNRVLIAEGGGISGNPRFRAGERVALEVHPLAHELPPMSDEEVKALAEDVREHGIHVPLLLIPDHDDPIREDRAPRPGVMPPPVLDKKTGEPIPKLKVGDGRHRLVMASRYDLPVRLDLFEGTQQEVRERIVSLNVKRRMLNKVQIAFFVNEWLMPDARREAAERREEGNRKGGKSPRSSGATSNGSRKEGEAARQVLDRLGNPVGPDTLRTLAPVTKDTAPVTREKAMAGEPGYRTAAGVARAAEAERKARGQGREVTDPAAMARDPRTRVESPSSGARGQRYSSALSALREAHRTFDPNYEGKSTSLDRIARLREIINEAIALIELERNTK